MLLFVAQALVSFRYIIIFCFYWYWFLLIGISLSCKDFKNWEASYTDKMVIKFEPSKDESPLIGEKFLRSKGLEKEEFFLTKQFVKDKKQEHGSGKDFSLANNSILVIELDPNLDQVSFELENEHYYSKVTINYTTQWPFISTEAGGYDPKYTIQKIVFSKGNRDQRRIFEGKTEEEKYKIHRSVLEKAKEEGSATSSSTENQPHVTIYY